MPSQTELRTAITAQFVDALTTGGLRHRDQAAGALSSGDHP
jgi:hypothetical protein